MKRTSLLFLWSALLVLGVVPGLWAADAPADTNAFAPVFERLQAKPDIIYLIANSSLVFGPDPNGRSEEITFVGFVTSPKWPMDGFNRRTLADGRQEIDMELTESELVGESYQFGTVRLGEHPDLRSLGTITQRLPSDNRPPLAATRRAAATGSAPAARPAAMKSAAPAASAASGQTALRKFRLSRAQARTIELNPEVPWNDLVAQGLDRLAERGAALRDKRPTVVPPATSVAAETSFRLPQELLAKLDAATGVDWDAWGYQVVQEQIDRLVQANVVARPAERFEAAVIPNDFMVKRKVLITTAKGILYNEAPVPVRGTIDSIPPVRHKDTPLGMNVFLGMELPVPLLDAKGNVDGWFYSKSHMAYAVIPEAIQRETVEGTLRVRAEGREELVQVSGPIELHHGETRVNGSGERETEVEVIVLSLRGRSELLGGDVMVVEAFSDRDRFSRGLYSWHEGGASVGSTLDLYAEVYTPSGKLALLEPLSFAGELQAIVGVGVLEKGNLRIPPAKAVAPRTLVARAGRGLFDEAERPVAEILGAELRLVTAPDGEQRASR